MTRAWPTPGPDGVTGVSERRMLAVGTPGGVTSGFADLPDGGGLVRLAGSVLSLGEDEYRLWDASQLALAAGPLIEQARHDGVADPAAVLTELEAARLVVAHADEPDSVRSMAADLSARLTGRLIGNGPHQAPYFLVAPQGAAPRLRVGLVVYQFLLWADGRTSIAGLCAKIDTEAAGPGLDATKHVVSWIPLLMRA